MYAFEMALVSFMGEVHLAYTAVCQSDPVQASSVGKFQKMARPTQSAAGGAAAQSPQPLRPGC
jgi:hypothetical protein